MERVLAAVLFVLAPCMASGTAGEPSASDIARVRSVDTWIDLGGEARPVAVVCPDRPAYREAARWKPWSSPTRSPAWPTSI